MDGRLALGRFGVGRRGRMNLPENEGVRKGVVCLVGWGGRRTVTVTCGREVGANEFLGVVMRCTLCRRKLAGGEHDRVECEDVVRLRRREVMLQTYAQDMHNLP